MAEVNLLSKLPRTKRNVAARANKKSPEIVTIAKQFGEEYFDGPRAFGYGGYRYDGRWLPVAHDIVHHFGLRAGQRVLDIGCAKGFLVRDLRAVCPGLSVYGVDISLYALKHCEVEVSDYLGLANCEALPFKDMSFDAVVSINTLHNCDRNGVIRSLKEIQRISGGAAFVQVDAYNTEEQRAEFNDWVLTAEYHGFPEDWAAVFDEAGYTGDYGWTIV